MRFWLWQLMGCGVGESWSRHVGPLGSVRTWFDCCDTVNGSCRAVFLRRVIPQARDRRATEFEVPKTSNFRPRTIPLFLLALTQNFFADLASLARLSAVPNSLLRSLIDVRHVLPKLIILSYSVFDGWPTPCPSPDALAARRRRRSYVKSEQQSVVRHSAPPHATTR
jgi:hypothetical protein